MAASKFTPEARGALLERFAAGASLEDACRSADVRVQTVKGWLKRGRKEHSTDYSAFVEAVEAARADARDRPGVMDRQELERVVSEAARKGSVAAMKLRLEQIDRERSERGTEVPASLAFITELRQSGQRELRVAGDRTSGEVS